LTRASGHNIVNQQVSLCPFEPKDD